MNFLLMKTQVSGPGLAWRCVLPRCPLLPSRVPRLPPVFFNTSTDWPRVLRSVSLRGPGCLAANQRCLSRMRVSEPAAARGSPQSSPGRSRGQVDRGPADAHCLSDELRRARDVYTALLRLTITSYVTTVSVRSRYVVGT